MKLKEMKIENIKLKRDEVERVIVYINDIAD